ncbi:hypothetical protein MMC29_000590 [Sticta canariensis]|nr:hypothetical protein [Sticta canariensis]
MLDANLPTFFIRPSSDGVKHNASVLLSYHGSDATPTYSLRHPDPTLIDSKNKYAAALYDSFNPEILYSEVLLIPQWTQPTLSQEEIRRNGGIPPPPQPILPTEFAIQLYNPDQQVVVRNFPGSWNSASYWEFEMPQQSFRQPSASALDRTQSDPTASETTPKVAFRWKKDGKLSKDYVCSLVGKSTNLDGGRKKHREPDIAIALFSQLKEITIYEPNLHRVDIEDSKGLEVVIILGAVVIREVYNVQLKEVFNLGDTSRRDSETLSKKSSIDSAKPAVWNAPAADTSNHAPTNSRKDCHPPSAVPGQLLPLQVPKSDPRPPPNDPRSQWEIDNETARLQKQVEHEERERRRADHAETKRIKKMIEAEERESRRKQAEIDKETERLRKVYAAEQRQSQPMMRPSVPSRRDQPRQYSAPISQTPFPRPLSAVPWSSSQDSQQLQFQSAEYLRVPGNESSLKPDGNKLKGKKSFFGIRSASDGSSQRLKKKQSSIW